MRFRTPGGVRGPEKISMWEKDLQETTTLRGVQDELADREQERAWKAIPDAKLSEKKKELDTAIKVLNDHGLSSLSDLVAKADLLNMREQHEVPDCDRQLRSKLRGELDGIKAVPDITKSYQYLANVNTIEDETGKWEVKLSRRRRKRHERWSADEVPATTHEKSPQFDSSLTDTYGNEIMPSILEAKQVVTTKMLKRIKKATAARRRAGEDVNTDDEMDVANFTLPPREDQPSPYKKKHTDKIMGKMGAQSPMMSATLSPATLQWGNMYLDPSHHTPMPWAATPTSSHSPSVVSSNLSSGSWMLEHPTGTISRNDSSTSC